MEEKKLNEEEELNSDTMSVEQEPAENPDNQNVESTEGKEDESTEEKVDETAEVKKQLAMAEEQIAELKDKNLRQMAEFDNYRKRTLRERAELILNGGEKVITTLLPVIDDMERAIENGKKTDDPEVLREGMELIYHKLIKTLEGQGVSKIETENADFNTDVHEAVAMVPGMGDDKKGKIIDCLATGYKLNDKVIRHAKVAVGQ